MVESVNIGKRIVGEGKPVFIVAEISANHKQSYKVAVELIHLNHAPSLGGVLYTLTINIFA